MRSRLRDAARVAACLLGVAGSAQVRSALATGADPNTTYAFAVGFRTGAACAESLCPAYPGKSQVALPERARIAWSTRLAGGLGAPPTSDGHGRLLLVHADTRVSEFDASGRERWSKVLPAEAATSAVIMSSGQRAVVLANASVARFDDAGTVIGIEPLPLSDLRKGTLLVATSAGGLAVASGLDLIELDAHARVVRHLRAPSSLSALFEWSGALIAVTVSGSALEARATGGLEPLGSYAGSVLDAPSVVGHEALAVVDAHKLCALDLRNGALRVLTSDPLMLFFGPPLDLGQGSSLVVADPGSLSERGPDGTELLRIPLDSGFGAERVPARAVRAVTDSAGVIWVTRPSAEAGVVDREHKLHVVDGTACAEPLRPTPLVPGAVLLACRSGQLHRVDQSAPNAG